MAAHWFANKILLCIAGYGNFGQQEGNEEIY